MFKKSALDKLGTLLLAVAIWYVVRQRTEPHPGSRPAPAHQLAPAR
jgi:hypothetical protein